MQAALSKSLVLLFPHGSEPNSPSRTCKCLLKCVHGYCLQYSYIEWNLSKSSVLLSPTGLEFPQGSEANSPSRKCLLKFVHGYCLQYSYIEWNLSKSSVLLSPTGLEFPQGSEANSPSRKCLLKFVHGYCIQYFCCFPSEFYSMIEDLHVHSSKTLRL